MNDIGAIFHYFIIRIERSFIGFLRNWYEGGFYAFMKFLFFAMERVDKVFALRITMRYFFTPLYNDRTILGYILGVLLRSCRILISLPIYGGVGFIILILMFVWMILPVFIGYHVIRLLP